MITPLYAKRRRGTQKARSATSGAQNAQRKCVRTQIYLEKPVAEYFARELGVRTEGHSERTAHQFRAIGTLP